MTRADGVFATARVIYSPLAKAALRAKAPAAPSRRKPLRQPTRRSLQSFRAGWNDRWEQDVLRFLAQFFKSFASAITTFTRAPGAARVGMLLFFAAAVADGVLMPFFALWAHKVAGVPIAFIGLLLGCLEVFAQSSYQKGDR